MQGVFGRPKDWVDIEEILDWGTAVDADDVLVLVERLLGTESEQHARLVNLLAADG